MVYFIHLFYFTYFILIGSAQRPDTADVNRGQGHCTSTCPRKKSARRIVVYLFLLVAGERYHGCVYINLLKLLDFGEFEADFHEI